MLLVGTSRLLIDFDLGSGVGAVAHKFKHRRRLDAETTKLNDLPRFHPPPFFFFFVFQRICHHPIIIIPTWGPSS